MVILFDDSDQIAGYVLLAFSYTFLVVAVFLPKRLRAKEADGRSDGADRPDWDSLRAEDVPQGVSRITAVGYQEHLEVPD